MYLRMTSLCRDRTLPLGFTIAATSCFIPPTVAVLGFAICGAVGWPYFQLGVTELYHRAEPNRPRLNCNWYASSSVLCVSNTQKLIFK